MKRLDRYLVTSFIGPFVMTFFIVIFVLSMQFLWLYIDELVGKGLGIGVIFEFMGWAACTLIPMALPLATLLASIMTLGGMGERNELLAMKAAGIPLRRILVPLIFVSALISVGAFFASNNLIPVAYNKIYTLRQDIANTKEEIKIPTGTFYDGIEGYILRIEDRDDETQLMHKLLIYDHTSHAGNTGVTLAETGKMRITPDKRHLIFDLYDGVSYQENNKMAFRDTTLELNKLRFKEQQLIVNLDNYTFSRSEEESFGDEVMSKGLRALEHDVDSLSHKIDSVRTLQQSRFLKNGAFIYMHQLDTAESARIVDFIDIDSLFNGKTIDDQYNAFTNAEERSQAIMDNLMTYESEQERYDWTLRRTDTERYRKFTLSLACLIFFFIGAPLGAIIRKGGFGTPVIISIFFFLIYYIIDITGKKLAREGSMTPFWGAFISTMVLLPIGIFLTRKSTQDSALFNFDVYKTFFREIGRFFSKLYYKVRNFFRKNHGRVRIVYMGTPEFAVEPLRALLDGGYDVAAVVTVPDKQSGRGMKVNESAVKKFALERGLPVLQPEKLKDPAFLEQLKSYKANLFVVVAFRMLPKEVWSMPYLGTFNLHASLLPQYRGAAPINWAIINGERITGVTTFMIDEQIDTGRILFQENCPIEEYDNLGSLHDKLMTMGSALVVKTVDAIRDHRTKPVEQDVSHITLRPAPKITKETCRIDWSRSARGIHNLVRGLSPYPCAFASLQAEDGEPQSIKIFETAFIRDCDESVPAGTVTSDGKSYIEVKCGKGAIRIIDLQLSGKKRMGVRDFLLGFRGIENCRMV
ncbi:MAG: methionyl-tRNA formyltransferase [Bacteroidales bacterium]|nr:methionyl-tRNA formyltransferase [Bacteroidales bacterium]